jgi:4-amino-4-deoxy-L-arabinose transferase-like glycosyltransferase
MERTHWLRIRWLIALAGLALVAIGQSRFNAQAIPSGPANPLGAWLNQVLHLGDPGVDNLLVGFPLLVAGGLLLALGLRGISLLPSLRSAFEATPLQLRRLASFWPGLLVGSVVFIALMTTLGKPDFESYSVPLWLAAFLLFLTAAFQWDRQRQVSLSPRLARADLLWMLGLFTAGVLIGTYRLQGLPDQLMGDEGSFWTIARDIAVGIFKPSIFTSGVYTFPVFSSVIQAWFLRLFGIDLWGWRMGSMLMGMLTVPPLYLLAREAFDRRIAVASSVALIVSPYFIDFSRLGYNNIQALFFVTLALYWLYLGVQRRSAFYLLLAGGMSGLGFYTYFAARFALIISLAFVVLLWLFRRINFRSLLFILVVLLLGFGLIASPYIVHGYATDPHGMTYKTWESVFINTFNGLQFYTPEQLFAVAPPFTVNGNELFYNPQIYLILIARGILRTLIVIQKAGIISEHYVAFPLAGTVGSIFYFLGLGIITWRFKQPRSQLVLLWFLANVLGLSALNTVPPRQTHMVMIIPALALMTGIGLNALAAGLGSLHVHLKRATLPLLVLLLALTGAGGLYDFFGRVPRQYHPQPDQYMSWAVLDSHGESFAYLYEDPAQKEFKPYAIGEFRKDIAYEAVDLQQVMKGTHTFSSAPMIIFMPPGRVGEVASILQAQWGSSTFSRVFTSTDGTPVLAAVTNTPVIFEQDKNFALILRESYSRPSLWILFSALLALTLLAAFFPVRWLAYLPTPFKRLVDWVNAPALGPALAAEPDYPEEVVEELTTILPSQAESLPTEPPEWAAVFPASQPVRRDSMKPRRRLPLWAQFKRVQVEDGADFYLRLHLPRLTLPKVNLPRLAGGDAASPAFSLSGMHIPGGPWLIGSVLLAITAQVCIQNKLISFGVPAYLLSAAGLVMWARLNPKWTSVFTNQVRMNLRGETFAVLFLLLTTIALRFFDLKTRVYGLEADETKWTVQAWYSAILRLDVGEFAGMHYNYLPVDFWVRSFFLRLFGLNFISARIESAVLSLIAVLCLYLLVRLITSSAATGLLAALLFSFSFIELNASHQALHNTPPEAWMLAAFFVAFIALRDRKAWQFQLTGILLALGMMTYETFYPNVLVVAVYYFGMAVYEIRARRASVRDWLVSYALVLWPVVLVYIFSVRGYVSGRQYYLLGWLTNSSENGGLGGLAGFLLGNARDVLRATFSELVFDDSLLRWVGPIVNPLLLPYVVLGLLYNLWNIRRPYFAFIPLWYLAHTLAGPILLGSTWPRVMYLAVPPLMIWGAFGLWTTLAALRTLVEKQRLQLALLPLSLAVIVLLANDYSIFNTKLIDPFERQKRRELADLTMESARDNPMLLFPYLPNQNDSVQVESHVLLYSVAGARGLKLDASQNFKQLEMSTLLSTLWQLKSTDGIDLIFDKSAPLFQEDRAQALNTVLFCYPGAALKTSASYFDVYHFDPSALQLPECYSPQAPVAVSPTAEAPAGQPITFRWQTENIPTTSFSFTLERQRDDVFWVEAEQAFQGSGWHPEGSFVDDFNGEGFLIDDWHAGETAYDFVAAQPGPYKVWIRYMKRRVNDQHNFINLAGKTIEFADNSEAAALEQWVWKEVGVFDFAAGVNPITLTRTYGVNEQYSVFIDSVVFTTDPAFQPGDSDSFWQNVQVSGVVNSNASEYAIPETLPPGIYRWSVRIFDGNRIVDAIGKRGVESLPAVFIIP